TLPSDDREPRSERGLDRRITARAFLLSPAFRRLGERCNVLMSCPFVTERAEIPFGSTRSDSAVGGHDLLEERRFFLASPSRFTPHRSTAASAAVGNLCGVITRRIPCRRLCVC